MVPNPEPGGEEPISALPQGAPQAIDLADAEIARGREGYGNGSLKGALSGATDDGLGAVELAQSAVGVGAAGQDLASEPMVRLVETRPVEGSKAQADRLLDAFSPMPRPPVLDLGIEVARSVRPQEATLAAAETVEDVAISKPEPSADPRAFAAGPSAQLAVAEPPVKPPPTAPKGIEPLASALDAAVRLAADANVAAEALENLKRLLQHKQQLDGLRSAKAALARPSPGAEASASEAPAAALPDPPLPPLPLPVQSEEAPVGSARLPLVPPRRAALERRGLDVRGFLAGFALSWAFGVVLYFFMTAG
jgi:hypothetical protein